MLSECADGNSVLCDKIQTETRFFVQGVQRGESHNIKKPKMSADEMSFKFNQFREH